MKAKDICSKKREKLAAGGALIVSSVAALVLFATAILPAQTRQEEVAVKGAKVMPFDLEQTTHLFQKLDDGGQQKVVVKDRSNKKQIALIQSHLREESEKFREGDFSDPAKIHGEDMHPLAGSVFCPEVFPSEKKGNPFGARRDDEGVRKVSLAWEYSRT